MLILQDVTYIHPNRDLLFADINLVINKHDKIVLIGNNRFLFTKEYWANPCKALSGGEKVRLMLCSLTISNQAPDIIIFDEPTNNLDIQNIDILTAAKNKYKGTLLVVSHDEFFLKQINLECSITIG